MSKANMPALPKVRSRMQRQTGGLPMSEQSIYMAPKSGEFEAFNCPTLGKVSPKACEVCRLKEQNKCPLGKTVEVGW